MIRIVRKYLNGGVESVLKIVVSVIGKIIRLLMFLIFSFGLTVGTTVLINRELREQLINIININL